MPLLRKLLLAALVLILVALGAADVFLSRYTANRELQYAEQQMQGQVSILAPALAAIEPSALAAWVEQTGRQTGARVTVIGRDGMVLADSQHDSSTMDNHAGRPEVRQALGGRMGTSVRHSATLDADLCYLAAPAAISGNPAVVLRLAVPLHRIQVSIAEVRWLILRASLVAAGFALGIAYIISRAFTRRVRRIQAYAGELVNAEYSGSLATESDDELGSLARSLRGMADQFRAMLRRLSDESARRQAILASMVEGVLAVDADLRVTFSNDSFARAVRAAAPIANGTPLLDVVRDPALLDLLKNVIATGQPSRQRVTLVAAKARVFDVQTAPLDEAPRKGAIAILHDVTELERLERVRKDFVANVSHELRTPLASIRGYAETLLDGALEDPGNNRKFLEIISKNTFRLEQLALDLLSLSELEADREQPPAERVAVAEVARSAMHTVEAEAAARGVNLMLGEIGDCHIMGQARGLEQVFLNLLYNAIKFNRPGGEVWLEARQADGCVRIAVSDTGIGIPSEDLPRIFERFYCVNKARSRETGGTGLGLSIVKHTVEKMSGSVRVESQLGKGSVFTVELPEASPSPE
jgi:two-component system phosphate regulon sensor histidine kinase PhoR